MSSAARRSLGPHGGGEAPPDGSDSSSVHLEALEVRLLLSEGPVAWSPISTAAGDLPLPPTSSGQTAALTLDVDKSGTTDFVIASRTSTGSIVWYSRTATGWVQRLIADGVNSVEAGGAVHDVDSDGDLDVIFGGDYRSNWISWWENPYPNYVADVPWTRHVIKNTGANKHHDMAIGDFDGDGAAELAAWNQGAKQLLLFEIPTNPRTAGPWAASVIYGWTAGSEHEGLAAADVDLDGVMDIVGGGRWFEYVDGAGFTEHVIDDAMRFTRVAVGQLIAGGRPEIVFVPGDSDGPMKLYEWVSNSWRPTTLIGNVRHGHTLAIGDVNADGSADILLGEMGQWSEPANPPNNPDALLRVLYGDGRGGFSTQVVSQGQGVHEGRLADLDNDGDLDILGKPFRHNIPRIDIWLSSSSGALPLDQWQRREVAATTPTPSLFVFTDDMDRDGLIDIIADGSWYRNPGSLGAAWSANNIGGAPNIAAVHDFDGDGDPDILSTLGAGAASNSDFVWGRNNGSGAFEILTNIPAGTGNFLQGAAVDRFGPNGSGPLEIALSWHADGSAVQMLTLPADPASGTWTIRDMSAVSQSEQLSSGDIDRDGDADLLLGTVWLRNDQSTWTPFTVHVTALPPDRNRLIDMNGDGRLDAVVGYERASAPAKLAWYEQPADPTGVWIEHTIATDIVGPMSLDVADMDRDGDLDVVVGEHNLNDPAAAKLLICANSTGAGELWGRWVVHVGDEHHDGALTVDIDADGDLDIVSIGLSHRRVHLYENRAISDAPGENNPPTVDNAAFAVDENAAAGTVVAAVVARDPDNDPLTFSITGGNTSGAFAIGATSGVLTVSNPSALNPSVGFTLTVRVVDPGGLSDAAAVTVDVVPHTTDRVTDGLVTLYIFDAGGGAVVADVSGVGSPCDLVIADLGAVTWGDSTLRISSPTILTVDGSSTKVNSSIMASSALTLEAWITPANTTQDGPARIMTLSSDPLARNFTMGQGLWGSQPSDRIDVRLRTTATSANGQPSLTTAPSTLDATLCHVVYTRNASGAATVYIDGDVVATGTVGGNLSNWDTTYTFALANELTGDRPWLGTYHLAAVYSDALTAAEVAQNYVAGGGAPGEPDDNNPPTVDNAAFTVVENVAAGTVVAAVVARDSDNDPLTFSITGGNSAGAFAIGASTGVLTVSNPSALNPSVDFSLTVRVVDPGGLSDAAAVTVDVLPDTPDRVTDGLVVLYTFDAGGGTVVADVSGVGPSCDLVIDDLGAVTWGDSTLTIDSSTILTVDGSSTKVNTSIKASNALTLEAWITPANATQDGPARIMTLSADPLSRHFTIGQGLWGSQPSDRIDVRLRTTATSANGQPSLTTAPGTLDATLTHVVYTRDAAGAAAIYIDGDAIAAATVGGDLSNWDTTFSFALANELTGDRPWLGTYHLAAVYSDALTAEEVIQNFEAGAD